MIHEEDRNTMERLTANKTGVVVGVIYFVISSITSFMFFHENLPSLVALPILESSAALVEPIVSGIIGLLLFDGAAVGWLVLYLRGCDNNEQRSIASTAFYVAIGGSAVASFAHVFLTGNSLLVLPADLRFGVSVFSVFIVATAVVFNFVAKLVFDRNSKESKEAIRLSVRLGRIQSAEEKEVATLDELIVQKTAKKLAARADMIAEKRSDRIVAERERLEMGDDYEPAQQPPAHPRQGAVNYTAQFYDMSQRITDWYDIGKFATFHGAFNATRSHSSYSVANRDLYRILGRDGNAVEFTDDGALIADDTVRQNGTPVQPAAANGSGANFT